MEPDKPQPDQPTLASLWQSLQDLQARFALLQADHERLERRLQRVEASVVFRTLRAVGLSASTLQRRAGQALLRSPLHPLYVRLRGADSALPYRQWRAAYEAALPDASQQREEIESFAQQPVFSVLMPTYQPRQEWLAAAVDSVCRQTYPHWELCICDDGSGQEWLTPWLQERAAQEPRLRLSSHKEPQGIAAATNAAAAQAQGSYLVLLDHDDVLAERALYSLACVLQSESPEILYSDEEFINQEGQPLRPNLKPDWSPELLDVCMYWGHLVAIQRGRFHQVGGLRPEVDGAQDFDLALRATEQGASVRHVPALLYGWREHSGSTAQSEEAKPWVREARLRAAREAMQRRSWPIDVQPGLLPNTCSLRWHGDLPLLTVMICSRRADLVARCLTALRATTARERTEVILVEHQQGTTPQLQALARQHDCQLLSYTGAFHFARMNNQAAALARGRDLLFLNDDVEANATGWLESLQGCLRLPGVAIAGPTLVYPNGALQHAGIVLGVGEGSGHAGRHMYRSDLWPWLQTRRTVSAVTGACLTIRHDVFTALGGFDEAFANNYNDVDLCLRASEQGWRAVHEPDAVLRHAEAQTRAPGTHAAERQRFSQRWAHYLTGQDPYYHPFLDPGGEEIALRDPTEAARLTQERLTAFVSPLP